MAYTKTLIGDISEKGYYDNPNNALLEQITATVDANLTAIETAIAADVAVSFGTDTPAAVTSKSSGAVGVATTESRSDHKHALDLGAATLADLGLTIPTYTGKLATISGTSTLLQLLAAIDAIV